MQFLITAGGTREYIDPVRFISNASSGRMGYALARAAAKSGHHVTLITAPTALRRPAVAQIAEVETTAEMFAAVKESFADCDCLIMTAAVADYTPARPSRTKLKKQSQRTTIELKPTADILKWAGRNKNTRQIIVGFALEDTAVRAHAAEKLRDKKLDMIVANTPAAIGAHESTLHILSVDADWVEINSASKATSARRIVRMADKLAADRL